MAAASGRPSSASSPHMPANEPLDRAALARLIASQPPPEAFGPDSDSAALCVESAAITPRIARWLQALPCPVIAIGPATPTQLRGCDVIVADSTALPALLTGISHAPIAAMVLVQLLRTTHKRPLADALTMESLAYATLQQGPEFRRWQTQAPFLPSLAPPEPPLHSGYAGETLALTLADPANHNAIGTRMRDALCEALDLALATGAPVHLTAQGRSFSQGGAVAEFGQVGDPATAHWLRSLRLPATRLARLAPRLSVHVQGAAIGAGAEIAAFGARVTASPRAWFQLPELKYGLIPGAGGTASLTARISRHRTAWMALTMARVPARTALAWGLVDAVTD
jgi:enoyl-CoA hydratase